MPEQLNSNIQAELKRIGQIASPFLGEYPVGDIGTESHVFLAKTIPVVLDCERPLFFSEKLGLFSAVINSEGKIEPRKKTPTEKHTPSPWEIAVEAPTQEELELYSPDVIRLLKESISKTIARNDIGKASAQNALDQLLNFK